jgi:type IV secretion system protein VirB10
MSEAIAIDDGMPLVGEDRGNRGLWIGLGTIAVTGLLTFAVLVNNRQSSGGPQISSPQDYAAASAPRPELLLPEPAQLSPTGLPLTSASSALPLQPVETISRPVPVRLIRARPALDPAPPSTPLTPSPFTPPQAIPPAAPDPGRLAPVIVYEAVQAAIAGVTTNGTPTAQATKAIAVGGGDRTYLVSQGTLIFAVLETAIDSTQSGQVRAMISNNVYNALGTKVLIPKGSRIFGEYKGDLGSGQSRAPIVWTRLIRPDGATIALDSPASDQLGRAGVKGRVNTHFGERLLGALLQSSIDFGVLAASRAVTSSNGVIVALPSSAQSAGSQILQPPPKPTLKVRHGTRISVLVARDLDFSAVE